MNWSGNFREGLAREIRENKTLAKITAYTVLVLYPYYVKKQKNTWKQCCIGTEEPIGTEEKALT